MRATTLIAMCGLAGCAVPADDDAPVAELAQGVALTQVTSFGSNPGALRMFEYVPPGLPTGAPLVVVMHGCTQTASGYAALTQWGELADRFGFAVVFPEQPTANNFLGCFSWFEPADYARGQGEALSIRQMVAAATAAHGSDPARVYATGLSAGGFMTAVMLAAYPEVFAAGAVMAGGPYACATSVANASTCQNGNVQRSPAQWGDLVRGAAPAPGSYPRVLAFHGATDATVVPADMQQLVAQWTNVHGIDAVADTSETFRTATHQVFRDAAGTARVETYLVAGMGHAVVVDPGTAEDQGGAVGAYAEDRDIYSSYYAAQFFGLTGGGGGGDAPPAAAITAPASGATVTGAIEVTATASDDVGVVRVEVLVDGAVVGSDAAAPYAFALDTTALANGGHSLVARAIDSAGQPGRSAVVAIVVANGGGGGGARRETFSAAAGPDQSGWLFGTWALSAADATGTPGSRSLAATAAPRFGSAVHTATWSGIALGAAPTLRYARRLALTNANLLASSSLTVIIDDGTAHVVDQQQVTGLGSYSEPAFTTRAIDLAAFAGKTVTLRLVVRATDPASTVTRASATLDDLELASLPLRRE